jgi:hypothetical protein
MYKNQTCGPQIPVGCDLVEFCATLRDKFSKPQLQPLKR